MCHVGSVTKRQCFLSRASFSNILCNALERLGATYGVNNLFHKHLSFSDLGPMLEQNQRLFSVKYGSESTARVLTMLEISPSLSSSASLGGANAEDLGLREPSSAAASPHPLPLCASSTSTAGSQASSAKQYSLNARKSPLKISSNRRLSEFWSGRFALGSQNAPNTSSRKTYPRE